MVFRAAFLDSLPNEDALDHWDEWNRIRCEDLKSYDAKEDDIEQEAISERAPRTTASTRNRCEPVQRSRGNTRTSQSTTSTHSKRRCTGYYRSRRGFWSELQNQPDKFEVATMPQLVAHILVGRMHHCPQHLIPDDAEYLTAFADYSKAVLWFESVRGLQISTSWTVDYGTWPPQNKTTTRRRRLSTQSSSTRNYRRTLRIMAAVRDLFGVCLGRGWQREDGSILRLNMAGIDANDETDSIRDAIRKGGLAGKLWPMHSRSFRHPKTPINDLPVKETVTLLAIIGRRKPQEGTGTLRYITFDTDHWKSHHRNRLMMSPDAPGSLTWFRGADHRMIADHHVGSIPTSSPWMRPARSTRSGD